MRKVWLGVVSFVALYGCSQTTLVNFTGSLPQGVTLIETSQTEQGKVSIPYSKYQLDNGLTVILSQDKSDPLVHVDVTYHVGSAREEAGKSGFAHFFEHMMFQGSENVGDQEHFKIVTEAGGTLNGTTNRDRTNYFETLPSNQLEKALWLESDRMGFLIDAVSQRKFEIQRDTVKNERAQNYDNRPYGLMWERMSEALYPEGHPYSWQTIGYVEDLDRVDVNDLKAFFLRWYGPNNATLTIGGDFDTQQTLEWVNKYFGSIPTGPEVKNAEKQPAKLTQDKFITLQDRIQQPMVMIGWPTTYRGEENQEALDALASILGDGKTSLLYQKLVKTEVAIDAGAFQDCAELACNFYVYAMGNSGSKGDLTPIYEALMSALSDFKTEGVEQEKLDQIIGSAEASAVYALESVRGKVTQLASNQTYYNQPDRIQYKLEKIKAVTPDAVLQVYQQFIEDKNKVVLSVIPKGKTDLAVREATFETPARTLPEYNKIKAEELNYVKAVDDFDRSVQPPVSGAVKATMPELYRIHLENGIEVLATESNETPTVLIEIQLPAGTRYVPEGKEGLADLTSAMMQEGTTERSIEQIQAELDKLGSSISFGSGNYTTTITVSSLEKNLTATLAIVQEMLFKPALRTDDFERLKKQALEGLVYEHQKPSWLASQATRQVLFADSAFGRSKDGTVKSVSGLTLDDVKSFYQTNYTPLGTHVIAVGDITKSDLTKELGFLSRWQGKDAPLLQPQVIQPLNSQSVYLVDKPGAPQSVVRIIRQGLPYDMVGEQYLSKLANYNLAGNFNSRINQNLREDKGYTYGANGYHAGNKEVGLIVFDAQVRADSTLASIKEFFKEMDKYSKEGVTESELDFMRLAVGQGDALKFETPAKKAQLLSNIINYSLDDDYIEQRNQLLEKVRKSTLDELSSRWFKPQDYQVIVVGDAKKLKPQLEELDIPVKELEISR
ncbi:M16 family metallopeptidase [Vibrio sp. SCSIO 43137]|uniref:M16 family metallopeptidase n=1 Tax=Vibrio sp. SCSIO 43137 TaxID=3021011 RepID=UPI0023082DA1|nr:pitrilysin family protein [Vibrio sp. SCSIO 43137]WCE29245.1 pitrilysin family protein [Vibrio sp. SCSIO 43137]